MHVATSDVFIGYHLNGNIYRYVRFSPWYIESGTRLYGLRLPTTPLCIKRTLFPEIISPDVLTKPPQVSLIMLLPILATAAAAAFATLSSALPTSANHIVHEKRSGSSNWSPVQGAKPDGRITLPVRIGLTESNLHKGDDILMEVSDPASDKYGKHLTAEQVITFPPHTPNLHG